MVIALAHVSADALMLTKPLAPLHVSPSADTAALAHASAAALNVAALRLLLLLAEPPAAADESDVDVDVSLAEEALRVG